MNRQLIQPVLILCYYRTGIMGLIQKLKNKKIFLDTAPLIYYIEENQRYSPDSIQIATAVYASADYFLTNDIRLKAFKEIEVLVVDELIKR